jgi:hypothetical protein
VRTSLSANCMLHGHMASEYPSVPTLLAVSVVGTPGALASRPRGPCQHNFAVRPSELVWLINRGTNPERDMHPTPNQPQDIQTVTVLVVLMASLCIIYWRITLRLIAIAILALAIYGAVLALHGLHSSGR